MNILTELLRITFIQRTDMYPLQLPDGRYVIIKKPLVEKHLSLHLQGAITLGTFILNPDSSTRLMVIDSDDAYGMDALKSTAIDLLKSGITSYLETSRRGGHLWLFFDRNLPGEEVRRFGKSLIGRQGLLQVELFPKQDKLTTGPGSLVRLPFGKHQVTRARYPFIHLNGSLLAKTVSAQIHLISAHQNVSASLVTEFMSKESFSENKEPKTAPRKTYSQNLVERLKKDVDLMEFIGRYVVLKPVAGGAVGKCPFHQDSRPSFGVNKEGNFWNCFAGCGAGSIIDFWMKWRDVDFKSAVKELTEMLQIA